MTRVSRKLRQVRTWVGSASGPADWPAALLLAIFRTRPPMGAGTVARGMRRLSWSGFRRSEGRWSVPPREREGDDGQPDEGLRGAEGERRRWGHREVAIEDRGLQGRSRSGVTPPDAGAGSVGVGVGARVVLVGGGGRRGRGLGRRPVVMRAMVRAQGVPDPRKEEQQGEKDRHSSLRTPRHKGQSSPARPGRKAPRRSRRERQEHCGVLFDL